jgi:hypothetical protein
MKISIRDTVLGLLLMSTLLLSATNADAACTNQSITYGQTVNGSLSTTDCADDLNGARYYADYYQFTGTAGDKIYARLVSSSFDPWLTLYFPSGKYTNNDNGGGDTTARIPATSGYYTLLESGTYRLEATSFASEKTGDYTLEFAKDSSAGSTLPSSPANVTATAGNGNATVSFVPGSIGSGTLVNYWVACGVDATHLVKATGSNSPITVTGLSNGTVYYCWALTESTVGYSSNWSTVSNSVIPTAARFAVNTDTSPITGLWWNQNQSGWGISLTQQGPVIFAAWFTYDLSGAPLWYVMSNCAVTGNACSGDIYRVVGGKPLAAVWSGSGLVVTRVGTGTFAFSDNNTGAFNYTVNGVSGTRNIARQIFASGTTMPPVDYSALWWNPNESGWGVSLTQQYGISFVTMFTYDASGNPVWYVASNCAVSGSGCTGALYKTAGGSAPTLPWIGPITATPVGTITFAFSDASNGTMNFAISGQSGTRVISKQIFYTAPTAGQFDSKLFVDSLFMKPKSIKLGEYPLMVIPRILLASTNPDETIDGVVKGIPRIATKIPNGMKLDFGKGFYLPGTRLAGSLSIAYSNAVTPGSSTHSSMNYVLGFANFFRDWQYLADGTISGSLDSSVSGLTMTLGGVIHSSAGDTNVSGSLQYVVGDNCDGNPSAGSIDFVTGSKIERISFTKKCDGTYDYGTN